MNRIPSRTLLLISFLILLSACSPSAGTSEPPATNPPTAAPGIDAPDEVGTSPDSVSSTAIPNPGSDDPVPGIANQGPWLMILSPDGLWLPNANYSGARQITFQHLLAPQDITAMPAPAGGYLAYITGEQLTQNLTLHLYGLPRGLAQTLPLVAPEFEPAPDNTVAGDPTFEAARSIFEATSLGWSPDGRQLAFGAVLESASADLYLLAVDEFFSTGNSVVRITDEPGQAINPLWSPDGEWIVYLEADDLGIGAGKHLAAVRAVAPLTGEQRLLYEPAEGLDELIVGWIGTWRLAVHSREPGCGSIELRTFHIGSGEVRSLWPTPLNGVALDPDSRRLLITIDQFAASCGQGDGRAGIFLLDPSGTEPLQLSTEEAFLPIWSPEAGMFFARTADRVLGIRPDGEVIDLMAPQPVLPLPSSEGVRLAWATHAGLWIAELGQAPQSVFEGPVFGIAWLPDGRLLFLSEDRMYLVAAPDFSPVLIEEGLINRGLIWVHP